MDDVYVCDLNNDLIVTNFSTQITSVNGEHADQKSNTDVTGIRAENITMHYLPRGLEKYFNGDRIKYIEIRSTGLREIHQTDLKPFTKLEYFIARNNKLRVIERDLFKFNPEIKYIRLSRNSIRFIDANVFKNLEKLHTVFLDWNICISTESIESKSTMLNLVKLMRQHCSPN